MRRLLAAAALVLLLPACASDGSAGAQPDDVVLTVFAAASLTEVLPRLAERYEQGTPGTTVELSFAGSQSLVAQVQQGAPADVVVTADEPSMRALADRLAEPPVVLARNALAIVTEPGDPRRVRTLADLARPDVAVVLGGQEVPVGRAARAALQQAGVVVRPVSEEPDVKAVLGKVRLGEADAGVVYATDLASAQDDVDGFVLPGAVNAYPGAVLRDTDEPQAARAFLDLVTGAEGRRVLEDAGFLPP